MLYGLLETDDMFQYLGGLAMALRHESAQAPTVLTTNQQQADQGRVKVLVSDQTLLARRQ
jgi:cobaltochelatase CobN